MNRVLVLPRTFGAIGAVSIYDLLKETGYCDNPAQISEAAIADALSRNLGLIDDWLAYSEDKRTKSGWYIRPNDGSLIVGRFETAPATDTETVYADRIRACAVFIKQEVETIRLGCEGNRKSLRRRTS